MIAILIILMLVHLIYENHQIKQANAYAREQSAIRERIRRESGDYS